jgi:hypothetical protein
MTPPREHGLRLCSACSGDYEDPDAVAAEAESPAPEDEEKYGE